jgi:sterol desaturase/sphingolipid hydroxylase (fatty acid hydroxylase superfamily)
VWAEHVIHHSSQHYNLSTALRQSWTGTFTGMFILRIPLALIGFHPVLLRVVGGLNLVYQFWIHTETIGRMWRPIEWIFNTPSHHRVHHATNPRYLDSNYAGTLIIWDRMFGTFVRSSTRTCRAMASSRTSARSTRYGSPFTNGSTCSGMRCGPV